LGITFLIACVLIGSSNPPVAAQAEKTLEQLIWAISYTYNFFHASAAFEHSYLISHFWSLAVEEQFYLLWPWLLLIVSPERLRPALLILILLGPAVRLCEYLVAATWGNAFFFDRPDVVVYVLPFSHFDAFATGAIFAVFVKNVSTRMFVGAIAMFVVVGLVTEWLSNGTVRWRNLGYGPFMRDSLKFVWGFTFFNLICGMALVKLREKTLFPSLMESSVLSYLGTISYGLYVFHFGAIFLVIVLLPDVGVAMKAVLALGLTIVISAISFEFFEKPLIRAKDRLFPRRPSAAMPETS